MRFTSIRLSLWLVGLLVGLSSQLAQAQIEAPSQGGEVSVNYVTSTSMELSFGTTGNGQGRILAIAESRLGQPVPLSAVNGQVYTADSVYGKGSALNSGYVIYNGTKNCVTVTGLKPNTYYYFSNAEYNTDGSTIAYNSDGISMSTSTYKASDALIATPTPLPVGLTTFSGTIDAYNIATLHWTTASERNSAYFAIERSLDGTLFTEAGRIAAAVNSNHTLNYQWPDPQRLQQLTYYRLRQVDIDGTVHYSSIATLSPTQTVARALEVYPNPSAGQAVQLVLKGYNGEALKLHISDALGRVIATQNLLPTSAQYSEKLTLPQELTAGTYLLTVTGSGSTSQKRIVISY
jgi:hypothetical protein